MLRSSLAQLHNQPSLKSNAFHSDEACKPGLEWCPTMIAQLNTLEKMPTKPCQLFCELLRSDMLPDATKGSERFKIRSGLSNDDDRTDLANCSSDLDAAYVARNPARLFESLQRTLTILTENEVYFSQEVEPILHICIGVAKTCDDVNITSLALRVLCYFLKTSSGDNDLGAFLIARGFIDVLRIVGELFETRQRLCIFALFASQSLVCRDAVLAMDEDILKCLLQMVTVRDCQCVNEIIELVTSLLHFPMGVSGLLTIAQIMHAILSRGKGEHFARVINSLELISEYHSKSLNGMFGEGELVEDLQELFNKGIKPGQIIKIITPYCEHRRDVPVSLWRPLLELCIAGQIGDDACYECAMRIFCVVAKTADESTIEVMMQDGITHLVELLSEHSFPVKSAAARVAALLLRRGTAQQRLRALQDHLLDPVFDLLQAQDEKDVISALKAVLQTCIDGNTEYILPFLPNQDLVVMETSPNDKIRSLVREITHLYCK